MPRKTTPPGTTQMGLSPDGLAAAQIWLEPSKGGYKILLGIDHGTAIGFTQKDGDVWRLNRLDLIDDTYGSPREAAQALLLRLHDAEE